MSNEKFTPGKWAATKQEDRRGQIKTQTIFCDSVLIGEVYESKANADLIAAAPEMYEALKQIINRIEIYNLGKDFGYEFHFLAKEAIAKANPQKQPV